MKPQKVPNYRKAFTPNSDVYRRYVFADIFTIDKLKIPKRHVFYRFFKVDVMELVTPLKLFSWFNLHQLLIILVILNF